MSEFDPNTMMVLPPIFTNALEEFQRACGEFDVVNGDGDLSAAAGLQFVHELAETYEQMGAAVEEAGKLMRERLWLLPAAGEAVEGMGEYAARPAEDLREKLQVILLEHSDDMASWEIDDDRANAWDRRANRS